METDLNVLERVKNGDLNAFSELVLKHQKSLLRLALRVVGDLTAAEDVVQESFIKAYQKLESFEGRSSFKSWLFQITLNTARNKLRGKRLESVDIENVHVAVDAMSETIMIHTDLERAINIEVAKLPNKQRMALTLRIFDDLSFAEIAEIMKCPYDTAKANYRHALIKLRHSISDSTVLNGWMPKTHKRTLEVDA
ncbi:MAG: sigma-70 family RNA polymerase sigma factor [Bdellovibrionota bacterium]